MLALEICDGFSVDGHGYIPMTSARPAPDNRGFKDMDPTPGPHGIPETVDYLHVAKEAKVPGGSLVGNSCRFYYR